MQVISNFYDPADSNAASYESHPVDELEPLPETRLDVGDDFSRWLQWVCSDCRRVPMTDRACASIYVFGNEFIDGWNIIPAVKFEKRRFFDAVKTARAEFADMKSNRELDSLWAWIAFHGHKKNCLKSKAIALRTVSLCRAIRPDYFPDSSISKIASTFKCSKAAVSIHTTQFLRVFKIQTRVMRGESARESLRACALKSHAARR